MPQKSTEGSSLPAQGLQKYIDFYVNASRLAGGKYWNGLRKQKTQACLCFKNDYWPSPTQTNTHNHTNPNTPHQTPHQSVSAYMTHYYHK